MPIRYLDPTGVQARLKSDQGWDKMMNDFDTDYGIGLFTQGNIQQNTGRADLDNNREAMDWGDRAQVHSLNDIVQGVTGGYNANSIISNFISQSDSPFNVRDHFMEVLEKWECSIPLNNMWLVFFKVPNIVRDEVMAAWGENIVGLQEQRAVSVDQQASMFFEKYNTSIEPNKAGSLYKFSGATGNAYATDRAAINEASQTELAGGINLARRKLADSDKFMTTLGCAFAQGVQIPQEQINTDYVGIPNARGFIQSPIITHRQRFSSLNIDFLETNISFVDFLLRPWAVLGGHMGAVARAATPIVTDLMVINLARAGVEFGHTQYSHSDEGGYTTATHNNTRGFIPRKMWFFQGCQPINISSQTFKYGADTDTERRNVEWMFRRYQVYMPTSFEDLFTHIHDKEQTGTTARWMEQEHDKYRTESKKNSESVESTAKRYWSGKDGDANPLDSSKIDFHTTGDGMARGKDKYLSDPKLPKLYKDQEADAINYWHRGINKAAGADDATGWIINSDGVPEPPTSGQEMAPGDQHSGWDKQADGIPKQGGKRLNKEIRPAGQVATNLTEAIQRWRDQTTDYADGEVNWNPYINQNAPGDGEIETPNPADSKMGGTYGPDGGRRYERLQEWVMGQDTKSVSEAKQMWEGQAEEYGSGAVNWNWYLNDQIEPIDPSQSMMGGTYGPDGGYRYQMDAIKGQIVVKRPYGKIAKQLAASYGQGDVNWNTYLNKMIPAPNESNYAMGGTYGPGGGYRYQGDKVDSRIRPK